MKKQSSIQPLKNEQIRCAISVGDKQSDGFEKHIFVGCTNGHLLRLDPVNYFTTMSVKLKKHIFCLLQIDENTILCGQLGGFLDLVRISDGKILFSQELKHTTGNIISMVKTAGRDHEIALATQKGVFFANVGKGAHGLRAAQVQQLDQTAHFMYGRSSNSLDPNH